MGAGWAWVISWELTSSSLECKLEYLVRPNSTWALAKNRAYRFTGKLLLIGLHIRSVYFMLLKTSTSTFKSICCLWGETLLKLFYAISICLSKPHCMWSTRHSIIVSFREMGRNCWYSAVSFISFSFGGLWERPSLDDVYFIDFRIPWLSGYRQWYWENSARLSIPLPFSFSSVGTPQKVPSCSFVISLHPHFQPQATNELLYLYFYCFLEMSHKWNHWTFYLSSLRSFTWHNFGSLIRTATY